MNRQSSPVGLPNCHLPSGVDRYHREHGPGTWVRTRRSLNVFPTTSDWFASQSG